MKHTVRHVFKSALCCLRFHPEIWYDFTQFEASTGDHTTTVEVFKEALKVLPDSSILHFAFADYLELQNKKAVTLFAKISPDVSPNIYIFYYFCMV